MSVNPIIQERQSREELFKLFLVEFITRDIDLLHKNEEYKRIQTFCRNNTIRFLCREYDSFSVYEDREYIERLPAIHIYKKDTYIKTLHMTQNPIQVIEYEIDKLEQIPIQKNYLKIFRNMFRFRTALRS